MIKPSVLPLLVVLPLLCSCSMNDDRAVRERVADQKVNTQHTKGTTEVLKNYRLPDVRSAADPKQTLTGKHGAIQNAKPKSEAMTK